MKIRIVILQPLCRRVERLRKPLDPWRLTLVHWQFGIAGVQPFDGFPKCWQSFLIEHYQSPVTTPSHCHTLSNCPAVFSNSSCDCCFWKFASRYAIHFSFSSSLAFSTSRTFHFPSAICACCTATFCCASCNSSRATSFAASLSRTLRVFCLTSPLNSVFLSTRLTLPA